MTQKKQVSRFQWVQGPALEESERCSLIGRRSAYAAILYLFLLRFPCLKFWMRVVSVVTELTSYVVLH